MPSSGWLVVGAKDARVNGTSSAIMIRGRKYEPLMLLRFVGENVKNPMEYEHQCDDMPTEMMMLRLLRWSSSDKASVLYRGYKHGLQLQGGVWGPRSFLDRRVGELPGRRYSGEKNSEQRRAFHGASLYRPVEALEGTRSLNVDRGKRACIDGMNRLFRPAVASKGRARHTLNAPRRRLHSNARPSTIDSGYILSLPRLSNPATSDAAYQRLLSWYLPLALNEKLQPRLEKFGDEAVSDQVNEWISNAERQPPYVKSRNVWGEKYSYDRLVTSEGWKALGKWGIQNG